MYQNLKIHLESEQPARLFNFLNKEQEQWIKHMSLFTNKPIVYIANILEDQLQGNLLVNKIKQFAKKHYSNVITICATLEEEISKLNNNEKSNFLQSLNLKEPGLNYIIRAGYALLNLQTYFCLNVLKSTGHRMRSIFPPVWIITLRITKNPSDGSSFVFKSVLSDASEVVTFITIQLIGSKVAIKCPLS